MNLWKRWNEGRKEREALKAWGRLSEPKSDEQYHCDKVLKERPDTLEREALVRQLKERRREACFAQMRAHDEWLIFQLVKFDELYREKGRVAVGSYSNHVGNLLEDYHMMNDKVMNNLERIEGQTE